MHVCLFPAEHISHSCSFFPSSLQMTSGRCQTSDMICPEESCRKKKHSKLCRDTIWINISTKYAVVEIIILTQLRTCVQLRVNRFSNFFSPVNFDSDLARVTNEFHINEFLRVFVEKNTMERCPEVFCIVQHKIDTDGGQRDIWWLHRYIH